MADRNDQGSGHDPDAYRPFNDPKHPSWYTDPSAGPDRDAAEAPGASAATQNPYADQPLAGPYGGDRPQYPIHGDYPVVANQPGQSPYDAGYGQQGGNGSYGYDTLQGRASGVPYPGEQPRTPGLGIAAMVCGIAGVVTFGSLFIPQVLAIVLGHVSRAKEPNGRGFALAGLVMGYVVTGLWALMIIAFIAFGTMF